MAEPKAVAAFLAGKPRKSPAWMSDGKAPPFSMRAPITVPELMALMNSHAALHEALKKVFQTISLEHSISPNYGWNEWLEKEILPALKAATGE